MHEVKFIDKKFLGEASTLTVVCRSLGWTERHVLVLRDNFEFKVWAEVGDKGSFCQVYQRLSGLPFG